MSTNPPKSFDRLWRECYVAFAGLQKHGRLIGTHVAEFRRDSYRMAARILDMQKHHHNRLVALVASEKKTPTEWMDHRFALIEEMNETRERLYAAIEAGVSEREYVAQGEIAVMHKRLKTDRLVSKDDGVIPQPTGKAKTPEELTEEYRDLYESTKSKYQGVRRELKVARDDLGRTQVRLRKMERTIKRHKKDIETLYATEPAKAD